MLPLAAKKKKKKKKFACDLAYSSFPIQCVNSVLFLPFRVPVDCLFRKKKRKKKSVQATKGYSTRSHVISRDPTLPSPCRNKMCMSVNRNTSKQQRGALRVVTGFHAPILAPEKGGKKKKRFAAALPVLRRQFTCIPSPVPAKSNCRRSCDVALNLACALPAPTQQE